MNLSVALVDMVEPNTSLAKNTTSNVCPEHSSTINTPRNTTVRSQTYRSETWHVKLFLIKAVIDESCLEDKRSGCSLPDSLYSAALLNQIQKILALND